MKASWDFIVKTAIRDSRKHRAKLFMFMSSIILGIAALVAINSFNYNLVDDINRQAATLLGADMVASSNKKLEPHISRVLDSLDADRSSELELFSMALLPKTDETQFVRLKGIAGDFPFYGKLKTIPESAAQEYKNKRGALAEEGLLLQYELEVGDSIKLGNIMFPIIGRLQNAFGSAGIGASFAPSIYISQEQLGLTNLVRPGSLVNYSHFFQFPDEFDVQTWKKSRRKLFRDDQVRIETIQDRKENLNEAFNSLNYFLNLVALVSLLLGCIGVASSVFIYVRTKIPSIAILRCLGIRGRDALWIYLLQIVGLGFISVLIGVALGTLIQVILPILLSDILPLKVETAISWKAIAEGTIIGLVITILFALLPLLGIRRISPLRTLRSSFEEDVKSRDYLILLIYGLICFSIFGFLWQMTGDWMTALLFIIGLSVAFLALWLVSKFVIWFVRKFIPRNWNFVWRQGMSNLFRPNNQTQTLLISIGLGTAVLSTLFVIQGLLLTNVSSMDAGNQPNTILYGIESSQKDDLAKMTKSFDLPLIQQVPIVTMKMEEWKGRTKAEWMADSTAKVSRWAANRELRVTYRDTLEGTEKLLEGQLSGPYKSNQDSIFVSLGESYAEGLDVGIGDEIIYNVQGTRIKTYVGSLREIDFKNMQARFFIVFPTGVLEEAPQFQVLVTKTPSVAKTAEYRRAVVKAFPNVSVVDLGMILDTLNDILAKVSYVIKFMAGFSILTGLIVLISSLLLSKFQRVKESVLLRTIGASRKQIIMINFVEYFLLGGLSALTGILLSLVGSFLVAKYQLQLDYNIQWLPIFTVFFIVTGLTVIIGLLNSREVLNKPPLEVLRNELS